MKELLRRLAVIRYVCVYYCGKLILYGMVVNFRGDQIFMDFIRFLIHYNL